MFILLDDRRIATIPKTASNHVDTMESKRILIALKYFDVFTQKIYFMDWVYIVTDVTTSTDITNYMEQDMEKKDPFWFQQCKSSLRQMRKYEKYMENKHDLFVFYEEVRKQEILPIVSNEPLMDRDYYYGDIFIFQLNPYHNYFKRHPIVVQTVLTQSQKSIYLHTDSFMSSLSKIKL